MRYFSRGRKRPGEMNKLEAAYSRKLSLDPNVEKFWFEGMKMRLADKTFYTPDFFVLLKDGALECHETKGFMMDDANVKIKVAAELFPFRFFVAKLEKGTWNIREV